MALRDQPYIPLYVQDYLTDEKLNECSAATQGIYMKIMCLMHKSEQYGKILLKQKYKQKLSKGQSKIDAFAWQLLKHLPFYWQELYDALKELTDENVLYIENDYLCQKRMIRDNEISIKRAEAGSKGGKQTQFAKAKSQANSQANSENENENENEVEYDKEKKSEKKQFKVPSVEEVREYCRSRGNSVNPESFVNHYESKGWYIGKNKMKDWKAAVRTWEQRQNQNKLKFNERSDLPL
jgi:uncharacterized protein YdaU (DUF1376 family)